MLPKIEFIFSRPYDKKYKENPLILKELKKIKKVYPSPEKISKYLERLKLIWKKEGKKILKEIEKISGLKWNKDIDCYLIGAGGLISRPLTIDMRKDINRSIDHLTHELIHNIQTQNILKMQEWFSEYLNQKYPKENPSTRRHILLHAIHYKIYLKLFNKKRLERDINICKRNDINYYKAWQIVEKEGADNIIKEFKKLIRSKTRCATTD